MNGASALDRLLLGHPRRSTYRFGAGGSARAGVVGWPAPSCAARLLRRRLLRRCVFFAVDFFFAGAFFARADFFAARFFVAGRARRPFAQQLDRLLERDRLGIDAAWHRGVDGAVGDVRTEATVEHADRRARLRGARPRSASGGFATRPRRCLGWAKIASRLGERHREELVLGLEAAAVGALLEVRARSARSAR